VLWVCVWNMCCGCACGKRWLVIHLAVALACDRWPQYRSDADGDQKVRGCRSSEGGAPSMAGRSPGFVIFRA
jgi:hypothetical protein